MSEAFIIPHNLIWETIATGTLSSVTLTATTSQTSGAIGSVTIPDPSLYFMLKVEMSNVSFSYNDNCGINLADRNVYNSNSPKELVTVFYSDGHNYFMLDSTNIALPGNHAVSFTCYKNVADTVTLYGASYKISALKF